MTSRLMGPYFHGYNIDFINILATNLNVDG